MNRPNLAKAIQMCGSVKSLSSTLKKYEKVGLTQAIECAKAVNWNHDQWVNRLQQIARNRNPVKETTIELFSHQDLRTVLYLSLIHI